jgi:hypothetical protein
MSIASLCLNGLLATLLLAALAMGVRLNRKLQAVKDGQTAFVLAVSELNAAAGKAQSALSDLRAATDEATDVLGGRIARAREAADRLDKLTSRAEAVPKPAPRLASTPAPEARDVAGIERDLRDATQGGGLAALLARMEGTVEPSPRVLRSNDRPAPRPMRNAIDDDLFEDFGGRA